MNDEKKYRKNMVSLSFSTSKFADDKLRTLAAKHILPHSRLLAIALDNELEKENPFEFDLTLPDKDEFIDNPYGDEGGKFLEYMKGNTTPVGLDMIVLLRHDMGISDKKILLTVFADCLDSGLIEAYPAKPTVHIKAFPEGYMHYRIPKEKHYETSRKRDKRMNEYDRYIQLKKKFEKEA